MPSNGQLIPVGQVGSRVHSSPPAEKMVPPSPMAVFGRAFLYRWKFALFVGLLLGGIAAATTWVLLPAQYTTTCAVRVPVAGPGILGEKAPYVDAIVYQKTQSAIARSNGVVATALKTPEVANLDRIKKLPDAGTWVQDRLRVIFIEDTEYMVLSFSGPEPTEAATILLAVLNAYVKEANRQETVAQELLLADIKGLYDKAAFNLTAERQRLRDLAITLGGSDGKGMALEQINTMDAYYSHRKAFAILQGELRAAEHQFAVLEATVKGPKGEIPPSLLEDAVNADLAVKEQVIEVNRLEKLYEACKLVAKPGNSSLTRTHEQLVNAQALLERLQLEHRPAVLERLQVKLTQDSQQMLAKLRNEIAIKTKHRDEMKAEEDKLKKAAEKAGLTNIELEMRKQEFDQQEKVVNALRAQKERLQVEAEASKSRVIIAYRPEVPTSKNRKPQIQGAIVAGVLALLLGIGLVSFREVRTQRIRSGQDVVKDLGMRVVGTMPVLPWRARAMTAQAEVVQGRYWGSILTESVSYLRTMILSDCSGKPKQLLMVASARPKEGKTMVAGHLAISIAQSGRRTLLVDGDLRRPSLSSLFQLSPSPGFCGVLRGEVEVKDAIVSTPVPGLSILPAGDCSREVIQGLSQDGPAAMFAQLRAEYDYIIVDSSPLLPVADGLLLGRAMDAVVLCIRPGVSQAPSVQTAHDRLVEVGIPILGIVVNGERLSHRTSEYKYLLSYGSTA